MIGLLILSCCWKTKKKKKKTKNSRLEEGNAQAIDVVCLENEIMKYRRRRKNSAAAVAAFAKRRNGALLLQRLTLICWSWLAPMSSGASAGCNFG